MQGSTPQGVHGHLQEHLRVKRWRYVVTALACVVVFCTTYALILPGTAMTGEAYCGKETHKHADACYERVLACGLEETQGTDAVPAHTHADACYETVSTLVCGQEEQPAHTHGAECYTNESTLTCGLEEGDDHVHDESCYTQTEALTCGLEETRGHTHDESCYQTEQHLICGQEETEGTPAVEGHAHTDACYENRLVCQLEEHEHSLACYSNPQADVESADVWERTLPQDLGDNWAENVVAVAKSQLGYAESTANYEVGEDNAVYGYTRYGAWYGMPYADWCAMFASFCLNYAGVPQSAVPLDSGCSHWVEQLQGADLYASAADCTPQAGYLVFFDCDGDSVADHVGVVTEVVQQEGGFTVKTIEGNSDDAVAAREYAGADGSILGYCVLPKNPDSTANDQGASGGSTPADKSDTSTEDPAVISADETTDGSDGVALVSDEATEEIAVGETKTLSVAAGQIVKLSFVPQYTHQYVFYSSAKQDAYGYLYDANGKLLKSDDDSGGNGDFKIAYNLTAGETYYWGARWYNSSKSGDIPVTLELGEHSYTALDDSGIPACVCGAVVPLSGTCGDDLRWSFDASTGTLTISGTGAMTNYSSSGSNRAPWVAFSDLISNVVVEDGATSIGNSAFYSCSSLSTATFPASLASIGNYAFSGCSSLQSADLLGTALASIGQSAFYNCKSLSTATFPASLASIGNYAFSGCSSLQSADLSGTALTSVGFQAFYNCRSLNTATFPASLASIGQEAFSSCASLQSADLSGTALTSVGQNAFSGCTALGSVSFPASLASIENGAFASCKSLQSVDLSATGVTSIGQSAFSNCSSLSSVSFPASLASIGNYAFNDCKSLQYVDLSATGVTSIGSYAFACSYGASVSLRSIIFPGTLESIGDAAFKYCVSLGSVDLSSTRVSSIGQEAFSNCSSLSTFVTPATPVSVGKNAFTDCRDLVELRLASADVTLDSNQGATNAQFHVSMANTVDVLASDDISALASMGCDSISFEGPNYLTITGGDWQVDFLPDQLKGLAEGDYFVDAQGVWYRIDAAADSASVFYCPAGIVTYTVAKELPAREEGGAAIPVTGVDSFAFGSASDLTSLDFESPDAITVLSDRAFAGATNLQGINGKSTASEVLATFTAEGLDAGTMLFWKTKIAEADSGDSGLTGEDIIITKDNLTLTVSTAKGENADPAQSDDGVYNYYTGESARTTITVSADSAAVEDGAVVRAYFQFDSKSGNLNYKTGEYPVESSAGNTYMMTVFKTDTENCYCVEFERPKQGDTLSITLESNYPSPTSAGGSALLWASILSAEEKGATGSKATAADTYQGMNWTTVVDTFPVTKKRSSTSLTLCGDGTGSAYLQGLSYDISMKREGSTLEGIGKDLMTSVTFEDVLTLPEGVTLADDVVQSIKDGTVTIKWGNNDGYGFYTSAGRLFLRIMPNPQSNYQYMRNGAVSLDDNGNLVVRWTFVNSHLSLNPPTEMDDLKFTYSVYSNTLIVKDPQPEVTYTLHNAVTATQHFMHSADQVQASECDAQTSKADSSLTLTKDHKKYSSYYGGSERYLITATNPGALPYEGLAYLTDDLPATLYMRPADLASAFGQDEGHQLTVTIKNVSICTSSGSKTVTGLDGASGTTDPQYSGQNTTYSGKSYADPDSQSSTATLTVCWDGNALKISVDGGAEVPCAADEASIQAALQQLGFVVNPATQYCLSWNLQSEGGTVAPLPGGAKIEKAVPCALKDTFMLLDADVDNQHPTSNISISNTAHAKNLAGVDLRSCSTGYYSSNREFSLNKSWSLGGASIDEGTAIGQGDVLDYSLAVTHQNNDAYYDALPLVDRMSGAQALMVPADKNSGASWAAGMKAVTYDGVEYYVLSMPGTYSDVWTSDTQLASSVQVTATDAGRDTLIKWYFVGYTGSRSDTVSYKSYVCPGEVLADGATTFALNNESWLGDRASHRLYATVPGYNGTTFDFSKEIVDSADESAQGYQYSLVAEGQTVIYRLTLDGSVVVDGEARTMTINGASMYDALPLSSESARWSADNVKVTYGTGATVTNGDSWIVTAADEDGQQNIVWGSDFSVTFSGKAYIYVELTFPSGEAWKEYANAYGASTLVNSYHVYDAQRYVTHELQVAATARLQKGVLDTGYFWGSGGSTYSASSYYKSLMDSEDDRLYYQNDDVQLRGVKYYVTLYNAGPTNLYLTDMQDLLPRGFTYNFSNKFSTVTGIISVKKDDGSDASQRNAYVSATASSAADGRQVVTFHFSEYAFSDSVSYDETREMCYLKPGESLSFYYTCRTNGAADTDNAALNAVAMPYYDFNGAGVVVDEACAVTPKDSTTYTPNDGGCEVLADADAQALGYIGGEAGTQWLASDVTVVRGEIKPGITKELTSKTDQYGTTTLNPTSAASTDTLNWTLLAENDGSGAVANYVLTDRMQSPYMFVGDVSCSVYSSASKTVAVAGPYTGGCLFTIGKPADDGTLPITTNSGNTYSLTVGGDPVTMSCRWKYNTNIGNASNYLSKAVEVQLSIAKDADGNAVMSLCLPDAAMSIPEGGHVFLTLSTYNATNTLANKQFINTCFVTPLEQVWDNTTNKGNVTTLETPFAAGELSSVRNSAPVTTTYGYTTSSSKSVAEVGNEDNKASCTADPNYIVLADASKQFRYTLTVNNTTEKAIDKLVLIDNLPEAGDHTTFLADDPRFSEFKVSLAAEPDFSVVVTDKDNNSTVLDVGSYSIEYSTATEFTSQDWNGTSDWSSDASAAQVARSVRLVIEDSAASLIPARSTISFSFTCQIDGDVDPGQVAWNSFGYHYRLDGERSELEAAPLKVGVKVPAIPELRKQVVDHSGQARTVDADATFDFLVYPGTALTGTYSTYEEWAAALEAAGVAYDKFTVTVKAGESLSDTVRMVTDKWVWTAGGKYNVVELPCGEDYAFKRFQGSASKSYTLTYNASQVQVVTCENIAQRWSVKLLKQNTSGSPLADAVFALYSPNAADGLADVPEGYADLDIALTLDHGGATWYLASVQTTPDGGELVWADLLRDQYYLLEVKAPAGYNLSDPAGQVLRRDRETQGSYSLTVINRSGYSLPETGGSGTYPYTTGGLVLLAGAVGLLASRLARRRGEDKRTA